MPVTTSAFAHTRILPLLDYICRSDVSEKQTEKTANTMRWNVYLDIYSKRVKHNKQSR